jgi:voltage-gated potassium channel
MREHSTDHFPQWRKTLYSVIFEAETPLGRLFDIGLLIAIFISVLAVILESVSTIKADYGQGLRVIEWVFTILFSIEYALRVLSSPRPIRYMFSFFGLVDILSIIPTYLSLLGGDMHSLMVIRGFRLLRIFRVLKLGRFLLEADQLLEGLAASRRKVSVFLGTVLTIVTIMGTVMYLIEGPEHGFTSIPKGIYWAIVTMTTVGYGDISPSTPFGQALASIIMVLGYGIIAVPTGIVTVELTKNAINRQNSRSCHNCQLVGHEPEANFCRHCGEKLIWLNA